MPLGITYISPIDRAKRKVRLNTAGLKEREGEAMIVFDDGSQHVHSRVLSAESRYFDDMLRNNFESIRSCEVGLQYAPIHAVWRTLNLIYTQSYTVATAANISKADNDNELIRHARVYQLARYWGLPKSLQDIPFKHFGQALQKDWELEELLLTLSIILHPTFPEYQKVFSDAKLREERIVKLTLKALHENLKKCDELYLKLYLDLSPFRQNIEKSLFKMD